MKTQQTIAENVQPATEKPNLNDDLKAKVTTQYLTIAMSSHFFNLQFKT